MDDFATPAQRAQWRELLDSRLRVLRAEVQSAEQAQREPTDASAHEVTDRKDDATWRQWADVGSAQEQRDLDEIAQVESALLRLEDGTYGRCADCERPIPLERLRARPAALRCAPCQATRELAAERIGARTRGA